VFVTLFFRTSPIFASKARENLKLIGKKLNFVWAKF